MLTLTYLGFLIVYFYMMCDYQRTPICTLILECCEVIEPSKYHMNGAEIIFITGILLKMKC